MCNDASFLAQCILRLRLVIHNVDCTSREEGSTRAGPYGPNGGATSENRGNHERFEALATGRVRAVSQVGAVGGRVRGPVARCPLPPVPITAGTGLITFPLSAALLIAVHEDADLNANRPFKDFGCRSPTMVRWWSA